MFLYFKNWVFIRMARTSSIYISMKVLKGKLKKKLLSNSSHSLTLLHILLKRNVTGKIIRYAIAQRVNFYPNSMMKYGEISSSLNLGCNLSSSLFSTTYSSSIRYSDRFGMY